jgi:hypothetical protein
MRKEFLAYLNSRPGITIVSRNRPIRQRLQDCIAPQICRWPVGLGNFRTAADLAL